MQFGPASISDEIDTWKEVYGIEERYKAKFIAENDGKYWLAQILDEWCEKGKAPDEYLSNLEQQTQKRPYAECNFLKKPFLDACGAHRIFDVPSSNEEMAKKLMLQKIKQLLGLNPGLKAKEIARKLELDKHTLNSFLHHNSEYFQKDENFCWHLKSQELIINFDQSAWINCFQFERALANSESPLESTYKSIIFVIPAGCNLLLESIARLMALSNQLVMDGKEVTIDFRQLKTFTYVNRIGFFDHLNPAVRVLPERPETSGAQRYSRNSNSVVELGIIDPKNLDESLPAWLKEVFVAHAGSKYEQTAFTVISELLGNVRDHSQSPIPGFVGLQFYKNFSPSHIQTVISDSGKGILGTLKPILEKKYPELAREIEVSKLDPDVFLLKRVFTKGQISQSEDEARGLGLKSTSDAASKFNANILIRQERCEVKFFFQQGRRTRFESKVGMPLIRGTHICFDFELDRIS